MAVIKALTLQFQPDFMDILPLYIVLPPAPLCACRVSALAGGRAGRFLRALGRGPTQQEYCAGGLSRTRPGVVLQPIQLAGPLFLGAWCGWRGIKGGFLAHQPLAVSAGAGWRAGRVPDSLQLVVA